MKIINLIINKQNIYKNEKSQNQIFKIIIIILFSYSFIIHSNNTFNILISIKRNI